jgi:hypothetical protein
LPAGQIGGSEQSRGKRLAHLGRKRAEQRLHFPGTLLLRGERTEWGIPDALLGPAEG